MEEMEALEPCTWKEAMKRDDWPLWKKAMEEEKEKLSSGQPTSQW